MPTTKYSRQRESIKEYLASTKEHPTADMVFTNVRNKYPNISLSTVYRNLNQLADHGEILKFTAIYGNERFDWNTDFHYHFVCKHCGRVSDLNMESLDHINTLASINFDGTIEGHTAMFYGCCEDCKNNF